MSFVARIATPLILCVVAAIVRLLSWHSVFQAGGVYPNGNDAYYHLQRIRYSIEHFPAVLRFDPLMNFPAGARSIWPPTFDWLIAAFLRLLPGLDQPEQIERYAVCIPPVIGVLTVLIVYALGLRFFSRTVGVVAGLSMAILPAHSVYSRVGAIDHHVLVAMLVAMMLVFGMGLIREGSSDRRKLGYSVGLGLTIGAAVLVWPGSLLQIGVLQIGLVIRLLTAQDLASAKQWALRFAVTHFVAFVIVLPSSIGNTWALWGPFSPVVLTNFQPLYFFAGAASFGLARVVWRLGWGATTARSRMVSVAMLGATILLGLLLIVPDLLGAVSEALAWFSKDEEFQSSVNESVALFGGGRGQRRAASLLGRFVYVVPMAIAYFAWLLRDRAEALLLLGWGLILFLATLIQWRFMNSYSIVHCLLIGLSAEAFLRLSAPRLTNLVRQIAALVVALAVVSLVFAPAVASYRLHFENIGRGLRGEATVPVGAQLRAKFVADAARFLMNFSSDDELPPNEPNFSVLGPWGDGHILKAVGGLAVVQDNFGDDVAPENFARAEEYYSARTEADGLEILAPLKTRFVLVRSTGSGHGDSYFYKSLFTRLYRLRGNRGQLPKIPGHDTFVESPLTQHRLIYQSKRLDASDPQPYIMIFEVVAAAELIGRAPVGSEVHIRLDVLPSNGKRFAYNNRTQTDSEGIYRFRLPYSTDSAHANVRVGRQYRVSVGGKTASAAVDESAVQSGALVEGPTLED